VMSCLRLPETDTHVPPPIAHVVFDNFTSWATAVEVSYTLWLTDSEPADTGTVSRLILGRQVLSVDATGGAPDGTDDDAAAQAADDLDGQVAVELIIEPGNTRTVERAVRPGDRVVVQLEVEQGRLARYDIDFGIMLLPEPDEHGTTDDDGPIRLFGPCRRATSLTASVPVPCSGRAILSFDNSGMWISSKVVRYCLQVVSDEEAL
jgi:hypothetical protein